MADANLTLDDKGKDVWRKLMHHDFAQWKVDRSLKSRQECFFYIGDRHGTYLFICGETLQGGVYEEGIPFPTDGIFTEQFTKDYKDNKALWKFIQGIPCYKHLTGLLSD